MHRPDLKEIGRNEGCKTGPEWQRDGAQGPQERAEVMHCGALHDPNMSVHQSQKSGTVVQSADECSVCTGLIHGFKTRITCMAGC